MQLLAEEAALTRGFSLHVLSSQASFNILHSVSGPDFYIITSGNLPATLLADLPVLQPLSVGLANAQDARGF